MMIQFSAKIPLLLLDTGISQTRLVEGCWIGGIPIQNILLQRIVKASKLPGRYLSSRYLRG